MEGFRERIVMTRFGEVRIRRRLYRDEQGAGRFLLDELLELPPRQLAVPVVAEKAIEMASEMGFRKTGEVLASLTGGALSAMSVWRFGFASMSLYFTAPKASKTGGANFVSRSMVTD